MNIQNLAENLNMKNWLRKDKLIQKREKQVEINQFKKEVIRDSECDLRVLKDAHWYQGSDRFEFLFVSWFVIWSFWILVYFKLGFYLHIWIRFYVGLYPPDALDYSN